MRFRPTLFALLAAAISFVPAAADDDYIFAVTTDYGTGGQCATIEIGSPWSAEINLEPTSSDPVVRSYENLIYVINRLYSDNIQVIDPLDGYETIREFSVGAGSNPQDIVFVNEERAYVSRYESVWMYEINPSTGTVLDSIDFSCFSDADGLPETSEMVLYGDRIFVQIPRIERPLWTPAAPSWIAVVDITTNQLVDVDPGTPDVQGIELTGLNPVGHMRVDEDAGLLYVAERGEYYSLDGGIETVNINALTADGFLITESELGGDIGPTALSETTGYVIVSDDWFSTCRLVSFSIASGAILDTLYTTSGFVPDIEYDSVSAQIFLCDRKETAPGIYIFDAETGVKLTGSPINTGLPPSDIVIVRPLTATVAMDEAEELFHPGGASWAQPNPFLAETRIYYNSASSSGACSVDLYDIRGRKVRSLHTADRSATGIFRFTWDGRDDRGEHAAPGVYFYRIQGSDKEQTGRVVVLR